MVAAPWVGVVALQAMQVVTKCTQKRSNCDNI